MKIQIKKIEDGIEELKGIGVESILIVEDEVAKGWVEKGIAIEYTDEVKQKEQEEAINLKLKEEKQMKIENKETIEVKAPTIQKKTFGETVQMICKATTGQNITTSADGGYLTYTELFRDIVSADIPTGVIWDKCSKLELQDRATAIQIPYLNNTGNSSTSAPRAYAVAEGGQKTVTKLAFGAQTLTLKKQVIRIPLTWEIMEDVSVLEGYVKNQARAKLGWMLDYLVFKGAAATNGYAGIATAEGASFRAAKTVAATITKASVINLISGVLPQYRAGSEFFMSNSAWASMMDTVSTASSVTPSFGLAVNIDGTSLMGYKVNVCEQLDALNSSFDVVFGNPKTYYVAYKGTPKELMSADFRWDYNESELIVEFRSAGAPCLPSQTLIDSSVAAGFSARS